MVSGNDLIRLQANACLQCPMCGAGFEVNAVEGVPMSEMVIDSDVTELEIVPGSVIDASMHHEEWCEATRDDELRKVPDGS